MNNSLVALQRAASIVGSKRKLASAIKCPSSTMQSWFKANKPVPAEWVLRVEEKTGGKVTRHELRPDIFGGHS